MDYLRLIRRCERRSWLARQPARGTPRMVRPHSPAAPAACAGSTEPRPPATTPAARARSRVPWAELLSRVFTVDVLKCENCGGRMTVLAFLTERAVVKILEHLGLPATGPPKTYRPRIPLITYFRARRLAFAASVCIESFAHTKGQTDTD